MANGVFDVAPAAEPRTGAAAALSRIEARIARRRHRRQAFFRRLAALVKWPIARRPAAPAGISAWKS
jgi:hypothetical protein